MKLLLKQKKNGLNGEVTITPSKLSSYKSIVKNIKKDIIKDIINHRDLMKYSYVINDTKIPVYDGEIKEIKEVELKLNYTNHNKELSITLNNNSIDLLEFEDFLNNTELDPFESDENNIKFSTRVKKKVQYKDFKLAIESSLKTMSKDQTKKKIHKIFVDGENKCITSTDTFQLSINHLDIGSTIQFLLTQAQIKTLLKKENKRDYVGIIKSDCKTYIKIVMWDEGFYDNNNSFIVKVDSSYVPYEGIVKPLNEYSNKITINLKELKTILKSLKPSMSKETPLIKLTANKENRILTMEANNDASRVNLKMSYTSDKNPDSFEIGLSARYLETPLLSICNKNKLKEIDMYVDNNETIVTFVTSKDNKSTFIILPMDLD